MTNHRRAQVLRALSQYLGLGPSELFARLELERDLGLRPLEIIWFVTAFEEPGKRTFPVEELERVQRLGALSQLIADWLDERDHDPLLAADEELFGLGPQSGSRRAAHVVAAE